MKTHREKQQEKYIALQKKLYKIINLDEFTYSQELFEAAYVYLEKKDFYSLETKQTVTNSKHFWSWWKNEYAILDELFLNALTPDHYSLPVNDLFSMYQEFHTNTNVYLDNYLMEKILKEAKSQPCLTLKN